jgi:hypothetical protein
MLQRSTTRKQQQQQEHEPYQTRGLTEGSVTAVAPFASPIHAEVDNEQVRILAAGNVLGMSPAYLVVDDAGNSQWVSIGEAVINDPNFLPIARKRSQKN